LHQARPGRESPRRVQADLGAGAGAVTVRAGGAMARIAILLTAALLALAPAVALGDDAADLAAREKKMMELSRRGAWAEALVEARAALTLSRKLLGKQHLRVATHHANVADLLARTGKLAAAEGHYRRAAGIQAAARGEHHLEPGPAAPSPAQ